MKTHLIFVHGLNCPDPHYHRWINAIPESGSMYVHQVRWNSRSWIDDLINIQYSKVFRDTQIGKVEKALQNREEGEPCILLSHSWGTVWSYKAIHRLGDNLKGPVWSIMCGAALGGTHLPFGEVYLNQIRGTYMNENITNKVERLCNLWNKDDHVSTTISMKRMENYKIDVGGFHPGFQEHDIVYYLQTMEFRYLMQQFSQKYVPTL